MAAHGAPGCATRLLLRMRRRAPSKQLGRLSFSGYLAADCRPSFELVQTDTHRWL